MALFASLITSYQSMTLPDIFGKVGLDISKVRPPNHNLIKATTVAQWILESGRGTSKLSRSANNFAGLKWRREMQGFAGLISIHVPSEPPPPAPPVDFCKFNDVDAFAIGYWKFLSRPVYRGLEDHCNNPSNFLGFLKRKFFAADPNYVSKVLSVLPEAQALLSQAGSPGIVGPTILSITSSPKEVEVGTQFAISGITSASDAGKTITITIDDLFGSSGPVVQPNGKWTTNQVLRQPGMRKIEVSVDNESDETTINCVLSDSSDEESQSPPGAATIRLNGSVGRSGTNKSTDVKEVKKRLVSLGYDFAGDPNSGVVDHGFISTIRLFQSITKGLSRVRGDGRVDVGAFTHRWLQAENAPRWQLMPDSDPAIGYVNFERQQTHDNHDFGTNWLADTILEIARDYNRTFRSSQPGAPPLAINDVSVPRGGDTPDHSGHETGLMCDILLPRTDGDFGSITWRMQLYSRDATRALLKSVKQQKLVRSILFNDPILGSEGLCKFSPGHDTHIHFEINPPIKG